MQEEKLHRLAREFGRQGGEARMAILTGEERTALAVQAAKARWATRNIDSAKYLMSKVRAGYFTVDLEGRVWRNFWAGWSCQPRRAEYKNYKGYLVVSHSTMKMMAHRMVWMALRGPIPEGLEINHKDGVKDNNHPDNLELVTTAENLRHAREVLKSNMHPPMHRGVDQHFAKLNDDKVREIRLRLAKGERYGVIAVDYGVSPDTIGLINRGKIWKHVV